MLSQDVQFFILFATLLLLPKMLLRFRIPSAITAMALGLLVTIGLGWFQGDQTVYMLATLGITSLFLFAGMEVDITELKRDREFLAKHLLTGLALLLASAEVLHWSLDLQPRAALLLALGLLTPSTGFILDSLREYGFDENKESWIRSQAIAMEIVALIVLFFTLQSDTVVELLLSSAALLAIIFILPVLFKYFIKVVAPFAPDSEFTFLILVALLAGVLTRKMGTYYLVGAFIVGVTARRFGPMLFSANLESVLFSLRLFFSFFIPFYFFKAGLQVTTEYLSWVGVALGLVFIVVFLPLRFGSMLFSIRYFHQDCWDDKVKISTSLLPNLVFGLVIASILRDEFAVSSHVFTGLILYTVFISLFPTFFLKKTPPDEFSPSIRRISVRKSDAN